MEAPHRKYLRSLSHKTGALHLSVVTRHGSQFASRTGFLGWDSRVWHSAVNPVCIVEVVVNPLPWVGSTLVAQVWSLDCRQFSDSHLGCKRETENASTYIKFAQVRRVDVYSGSSDINENESGFIQLPRALTRFTNSEHLGSQRTKLKICHVARRQSRCVNFFRGQAVEIGFSVPKRVILSSNFWPYEHQWASKYV